MTTTTTNKLTEVKEILDTPNYNLTENDVYLLGETADRLNIKVNQMKQDINGLIGENLHPRRMFLDCYIHFGFSVDLAVCCVRHDRTVGPAIRLTLNLTEAEELAQKLTLYVEARKLHQLYCRVNEKLTVARKTGVIKQ